jgi:hypothetical protein
MILRQLHQARDLEDRLNMLRSSSAPLLFGEKNRISTADRESPIESGFTDDALRRGLQNFGNVPGAAIRLIVPISK